MSDINLASAPPASRTQRAPGRLGDIIFGGLTRLAAVVTLLLLGGIIVSLLVASLPTIQKFGFSFLWRAEWDPPSDSFGALVPIYGTIATSLIALIIAVPVSFGIALFLTELSPAWLRRPLGVAIELLAAIPSIVYGMWGLLVFAPIFATYFEKPLGASARRCPADRPLLPGPADRHRHPVRRRHSRDHDHPVHRGRDARRVRSHAGAAEGIGVRHRLHDLGSDVEDRAAVHADRRDRRRDARPRPRARRDDGGDLRDRQHEPARQRVAVFAGQQHYVGARQRIR